MPFYVGSMSCVGGEFVGRGRVPQNPDNFPFWQDFMIIQCQQQRLAYGQRSEPGNLVGNGHERFRFQLKVGRCGTCRNNTHDLVGWTDPKQYSA